MMRRPPLLSLQCDPWPIVTVLCQGAAVGAHRQWMPLLAECLSSPGYGEKNPGPRARGKHATNKKMPAQDIFGALAGFLRHVERAMALMSADGRAPAVDLACRFGSAEVTSPATSLSPMAESIIYCWPEVFRCQASRRTRSSSHSTAIANIR